MRSRFELERFRSGLEAQTGLSDPTTVEVLDHASAVGRTVVELVADALLSARDHADDVEPEDSAE